MSGMQERMWHFLPWGFPTWRQGNGRDDLGRPLQPCHSCHVSELPAGKAAAEIDPDGLPSVYLSLRWPNGSRKVRKVAAACTSPELANPSTSPQAPWGSEQ